MRLVATAAALAVTGALLTACSGVPSSSAPQVITPIAVNRPTSTATISPEPGDDPGAIVTGFLSANDATDDPHHSAARSFLTVDARNRWSDGTVTVVDGETIPIVATAGQVRFKARVLGKIDNTGVYTPVLDGDGSGTATVFSIGVTKQNGQWRISSPYPGLIVDSSTFASQYRSYNVYFFDGSGTQPVADPRYTDLSDPEQLTTWLIDQLVGGPQNALASLSSPPPSLGQRVVATYDSNLALTTVQVPGADQLGATIRNSIATLLALTLDQVSSGQHFRITDGGRAVTIQAAGSTTFTAVQLDPAVIDYPSRVPALYYLKPDTEQRTAIVVDDNGNPVPGPLGQPQYGLDSVGLGREGGATLSVAVTTGPDDDAQLRVGTLGQGTKPTGVPSGPLTRPSWAPNVDEVWVGDGSKVFRVSGGGAVSQVVLTRTTGSTSGTITSLRLSPDGAHVALTEAHPDGTAELLIGVITRDPGVVRIDDLQVISPSAIRPYDVAWLPQLIGEDRLFLLGRDSSGTASVYDVRMDGSRWSDRGTSNLPGTPDSLTMGAGSSAWVSTLDTVWYQPSGGRWANPSGEGSTSATDGTDPVYVE